MWLLNHFSLTLLLLCVWVPDSRTRAAQERLGIISVNSLKCFHCCLYMRLIKREIPLCKNLQVRTHERRRISHCTFWHMLYCAKNITRKMHLSASNMSANPLPAKIIVWFLHFKKESAFSQQSLSGKRNVHVCISPST